jgi:hypothetical protein
MSRVVSFRRRSGRDRSVPKQDSPGGYEFAATPVWNDPDSSVDTDFPTYEASDDRALQLLVRRTPPPVHGAARGAVAGGHGRSGFNRGATHRPTGK